MDKVEGKGSVEVETENNRRSNAREEIAGTFDDGEHLKASTLIVLSETRGHLLLRVCVRL